jgi:hypothetical protein
LEDLGRFARPGIRLWRGTDKGSTIGPLAPENYPGIRLQKADSTGPPLSLDLFEKTKGVPYKTAVRAFLTGPDSRIIAEYVKSPDGSYLLDLPSGTEFPAGRYDVRIVFNGSTAQLIRKISFVSSTHDDPSPGSLNIYITEALEGPLPRTTFDTDSAGEKLLKAGTEQIDRAVIHYKEAYEALDHRSSYELRWKTTLHYARALHDAVLWHRYDYIRDARMLFEKLLDEYKLSSSRWFWRAQLADIGIKEPDIVEPLRDLEALELQRLYVEYSLEGKPEDFGKLSSSVSSFARRFRSDEAALSKRLKIDTSQLTSAVDQLRSSLRKLQLPVLVDLEDGNFLVANIKDGSKNAALLDPLDLVLPLPSVGAPN